jgi:carbon storage regulator CsrA
MLVLTRKAGEKIVIGGNITITLLSCHKDSVRIGVEAPRDVGVLRAEILERRIPRGRADDQERSSLAGRKEQAWLESPGPQPNPGLLGGEAAGVEAEGVQVRHPQADAEDGGHALVK